MVSATTEWWIDQRDTDLVASSDAKRRMPAVLDGDEWVTNGTNITSQVQVTQGIMITMVQTIPMPCLIVNNHRFLYLLMLLRWLSIPYIWSHWCHGHMHITFKTVECLQKIFCLGKVEDLSQVRLGPDVYTTACVPSELPGRQNLVRRLHRSSVRQFLN